jgi:hypothetical protein
LSTTPLYFVEEILKHHLGSLCESNTDYLYNSIEKSKQNLYSSIYSSVKEDKMALERILVGDDQVDFARENFPYIPDAEVEFVSDPGVLVEKARTGNYAMVVTDLNYTEGGEEGFTVLEALQGVTTRKVLWTGNAYDKGVKERGEALGAEVLDKSEIGSLVGQTVNKAPLKQEGKVLVYVNAGQPVTAAMKQVMGVLMGENVVVSSDLKGELATGQYGLVVDTSTMLGNKSAHGAVAHDMKYVTLVEVPRVVCVRDVSRVVPDVVKAAGAYLKK